MTTRRSILFICTHNSARSQMAEGLLKHIQPAFDVYSAGTEPGGVNPFAIAAMQELKIDISEHTSDSIDRFTDQNIDFVITVCDSARESCPYFPAVVKNLHESFPDPSAATGSDDEKLASFRYVRDQIHAWIRKELIPLTMTESGDGIPDHS